MKINKSDVIKLIRYIFKMVLNNNEVKMRFIVISFIQLLTSLMKTFPLDLDRCIYLFRSLLFHIFFDAHKTTAYRALRCSSSVISTTTINVNNSFALHHCP